MAILVAACGAGADDRNGARGTISPGNPPPLLLISIDGFRHDYLDMAELPALEKLAADGLKADSLMHVFPTKTFATHYALVTGLYAENSGVVANNMWDPERKARFSLGNRDAVMDGYWYDGEPIWNTVEKAGGTAATYFWPGSEAPIGGMRPTYWKPYAGDTPHDARVDQVLAWLDLPEDERPDFLTLYFSAVDSAGHSHGIGHPETINAMREVDRALGRLLDGLETRGLYGNLHVLVTSDHGMAPVDLDNYVMLEDFVGLDRVNVSDWGPAAQIWTVEDGPDADAIVASINAAIAAGRDGSDGIRRVWKKGEGPERYRFDDHQRVPDVTVEAEPGWMISNKPYYAGVQRGTLKGMHGWDPAWLAMHGIFIANGPAFQPGERLPTVRSVDLYSLMAELVGVPPASTDGSLAAFGPLLETESPLSVRETEWRCGTTVFTTRTAPGIAALRVRDDAAVVRVFALPQRESTSGTHYADADVEIRDHGDRATITFGGRQFSGCTAESG